MGSGWLGPVARIKVAYFFKRKIKQKKVKIAHCLLLPRNCKRGKGGDNFFVGRKEWLNFFAARLPRAVLYMILLSEYSKGQGNSVDLCL